jgi:hypothetical protein
VSLAVSLAAGAFLETLVAFLLPYFTTSVADTSDARAEIIETLTAYAPRTRAEMLQAARIIALGMATLDTLAEAKSTEMSDAMRVRYLGCANRLNRSTMLTENSLRQRLACEPTTAPQAAPAESNHPGAEPRGTRDSSEINGRKSDAHHTAAARPPPPSQRDERYWAGAMMDILQQMGIPAQAAEL